MSIDRKVFPSVRRGTAWLFLLRWVVVCPMCVLQMWSGGQVPYDTVTGLDATMCEGDGGSEGIGEG